MEENEKLQDPNREENSNKPGNSRDNNTYPEEIISSEDNILPDAGANTTIEQPSTINTKFSTEQDMEVHHHTHHEHGKRSWKSYFWEFLMLFLAVFCGFLAEYQLEHTIEHQREKKLVQSLIHDLASDTLRLKTIISARTEKAWKMDSLSAILNAGPPFDSSSVIYNYAVWVLRTIQYRFISHEGTMQQLKNAGGLRLIQKLYLADSITKYDGAIRTLQRQQDLEESVMGDYRVMAHRIFDGRIFNRMMNADNIPSPVTDNPPLIAFTKPDLVEFNFKLYLVQSQNRVNRREGRRLLMQGVNLINLLKKEYNIK